MTTCVQRFLNYLLQPHSGLLILLTVLLCASSGAAESGVVGHTVDYPAGSTICRGYLVEDRSLSGKRPAVLVVPEWWGVNEYARKRATMLADLGYTALVVDMYGDGIVADSPAEAGRLAARITGNHTLKEERFHAALAFIRRQPGVDSSRIAAVGYCFGGAVVLHMARIGTDLRGVASFHGSLATDTPALPGEVKANILVFHGAADRLAPQEQVRSFLDEMTLSGAPFRYVAYLGAKHSFTNPEADRYAEQFNLPLAYDRQADQDSWMQLKRFLYEIFKK